MSDYKEVLDELEEEVNQAEEDFSQIAEEENLDSKEKKAANLIEEIHGQIDFLENQLERIDETD